MEAVAHQPRDLPSAEEKRRQQHRQKRLLGKVGEHEDRLLAAGVFSEITLDQFRVAFRQVERDTLGFRGARDEQENEGERLHNNSPARDKSEPHAALSAHDFLKVSRADGMYART